jgi:hypothetical protein
MLRQAAVLGKGEDEQGERNDEKQRLARHEQQDACADDRAHQKVYQNSQSKLHAVIIESLAQSARSTF